MPRITYSPAQKQEAVALAVVVGHEAAAQTLGIDERTVLTWMRAAGKAPTLEAPAAGWQELMELAQAKVAKSLAAGRMSPVQAATIAGIAARNIREPKEAPEPKTEVELWADRLEAAIEAEGMDLDLAVVALLWRYDECAGMPAAPHPTET